MRKLRAFSGLVAWASLEPASNVMSWSRNWPKNVVPAVCVGLFGLFALSDRSTISAFAPADSGSAASSRPPGFPSSTSAASTAGVCTANGGSSKIRPK